MRPVKLTIEGLQSYIEPQIIDFELLSKSGLFGIFGSTGSGKSTVLDAILIALYGKGSRGKDYINKTLDRAFVSFEFMMAGWTYKAERTFKRKKEGGIECTSAKLFKKSPQGWQCVAENVRRMTEEIKNIVGLESEDFKKCVILPQGEFASFLKADKKDRNQIIGNLFDLEQYGDALAQKIRVRKERAEADKEGIERAIGAIGDFDRSLIEEKQKAIERGEAEAGQLEERVKAFEKGHKDLEEKLKINRDFLEAKGKLEELEGQREETERLKALFDEHKRAEKVRPHIAEYDRLTQKRESIKADLERCVKSAEELGERTAKAYETRELSAKLHKEASESADSLLPKLEACKVILRSAEQAKGRLSQKRSDYLDKKKAIDKCGEEVKEIREKIEKISKEKDILNEKLDIATLLKKSRAEGGLEEVEGAIGYASSRFEAMLPYLGGRKKALDEIILSLSKGVSGDFPGDYARLKELEEELKKLEGDKKALEAKEKSLGDELVAIENEGKKIKEEIAGYTFELKNSGIEEGADEKVLDGRISEIREKLKELEQRKNSTETEYQNLNVRHEREKAELQSLSKNLFETAKELERKERELKTVLKECSFSGIDEARRITGPDIDAVEIETKIKSFEQNLILAKGSYEKLRDKYDESIDGQKLEESGKQLDELKKRQREMTSFLAVQKSRLEKLKEDWDKLSKLNEEKKKTKKLCGNLDILQKLTRGKAFMEYIAEEYVQDITAAASRHTSHLTGGRYRLCYDKGEFFVEDNYSGGEMRPAETLSGGETFLISLSLALALTEIIVKMSDKPIEFFFLDEGFGTLDRELCDTVMNILEKLKRSNFTIGIISHVPELMQRMNNKLFIEAPDGNRGSIVNHIY